MSYAQQLQQEAKARRARLYAPRPKVEHPKPMAAVSPADIIMLSPRTKTMDHVAPRDRDWLLVYSAMYPVRGIQEIVCARHGFNVELLISHKRNPPLCILRQTAMYLARKLTGRSLPELGRMFGGRDHTTVLHGIRKTEQRIAADPSFAWKVHETEQAVRFRMFMIERAREQEGRAA